MKSSVKVFLALFLLAAGTLGYATTLVYSYFDAFTATDYLPALVPAHIPLVKGLSVSALCLRVWMTIVALVTGIAFAAGSSAGNLSKEFPFVFRLAAWCRTPMLMFIVVPVSFFMRNLAEFQIW